MIPWRNIERTIVVKDLRKMRETSVSNKIVIAERDNIAAVMENGKVSEFFVHRGEIILGDVFLA